MSKEVLQQIELKTINYWKVACILLSILLFVSCFFVVISFSKSCPKCNTSQEFVNTTKQENTNEKKDDDLISNEYTYLIQEFNLIRDLNGLAESQLFGFKFNSFHKDWECLNAHLNYHSDGVSLMCQQKQCLFATQSKFPNTIQVERSQECTDELDSREYAQSVLPSFEIKVSPIYVEEGENLLEVENFNPNEFTARGIAYSFKIIESNDNRETGWVNQYEVVFYSPKEISDSLSNYIGTYYGSEKIYAKYRIVVNVYDISESEKTLTQEKFLNLIEKMIDSIKFLDQPKNI